MGAAYSKIEEDKALELCRERKKFVRQALDGRCSLAAAHVSYIQSLRSTGAALRAFVHPEGQVDSPLNTSIFATPETFASIARTPPQFPFPSPAVSQADASGEISPSPPPPLNSRHYQTYNMKFQGSVIRKIEEKPPAVLTGILTSSRSPQRITNEIADKSLCTSSLQSENPPWDYFGLLIPADDQLPSHGQSESANGFDNFGDLNQINEDEGIPELEDEAEKVSSKGRGGSQESEDEFDEPEPDSLVRSFENLSRRFSHSASGASPTVQTEENIILSKESVNGVKVNPAKLSPLILESLDVALPTNIKMTGMKDAEDGIEHKVAPKDFFQSMRDVERLFMQASDSGKEVPRMLEANKFHYRQIMPRKQSGPLTSTLLKSCFSFGKDRSQIHEEISQNTTKYLTWHRTASSRSSSSRNPLDPNSDTEVLSSNPFEHSCMISGSHASTLDRLYAWEEKLYDEVKTSQSVRQDYDIKCKLLRLQESKGESSHKIDKTRAKVKDLHSRIRVAIHRIDSLSKRIEELRDQELQPQLEELIEGLCRMWETMSECHKLQLHVISIAHSNSDKIYLHSESNHQTATDLKNELGSLSLSFTKWVSAQKSYVEVINSWLLKCVTKPQKSSKRKSRHTSLSSFGPPIYTTCRIWLEKLKALPAKEVADSLKGLAAEASQFLPSQEKTTPGKEIAEGNDPDSEVLHGDDWNRGYSLFRSSLVIFLSHLNLERVQQPLVEFTQRPRPDHGSTLTRQWLSTTLAFLISPPSTTSLPQPPPPSLSR